MARQLHQLLSKSLSRKVTVLTVGGALCLTVFGTAAITGGAGNGEAPAAAPALAAVAAYVRPMIPRRPALARRPVFSRSLLSRRIAFSGRPGAKRRQSVAYRLARVAIGGARTGGTRARGALTRRLTVQRQIVRRSGRHRGGRGQSWGLSGGPRQIAEQLLGGFGWSPNQFSCLDSLWMRESGWNVYAENPASGAYGIPQALPAGKMASAGGDWRVDATTQIRWGLGYIQDTYGSPCGAWDHEEARGWY